MQEEKHIFTMLVENEPGGAVQDSRFIQRAGI